MMFLEDVVTVQVTKKYLQHCHDFFSPWLLHIAPHKLLYWCLQGGGSSGVEAGTGAGAGAKGWG